MHIYKGTIGYFDANKHTLFKYPFASLKNLLCHVIPIVSPRVLFLTHNDIKADMIISRLRTLDTKNWQFRCRQLFRHLWHLRLSL